MQPRYALYGPGVTCHPTPPYHHLLGFSKFQSYQRTCYLLNTLFISDQVSLSNIKLVGPISYRFTYISFNANLPPRSTNKSKFDLENPRSRSEFKDTQWAQHPIDSHQFSNIELLHGVSNNNAETNSRIQQPPTPR